MAKLSSIEVSISVICLPSTYPIVVFIIIPALVLATGSKWSGPTDLPDSGGDLRQFASQWRERFKAAPDVVIVGGGAVGVELSGEIRDEYPVRHTFD